MRVPAWVMVVLVGCGSEPEGTNPGDCTDGVDNDNNGLVDSFDPGCTVEDEGDEAGECEDGDDNDGDELVDCDDDGCSGNEACDVADTDGAFVHDGLASVSLTYTLVIKTRSLNGAETDNNPYCNATFNLCDCTMTFTGEGTFEDGAGDIGTFVGSYYRTSDVDTNGNPCNSAILEAVWSGTQGSTVYHTFRWISAGTLLDEWIAHADPAKSTPIPVDDDNTENGPKANQQFYVLDMASPYSLGSPGMSFHTTGHVDDATNFVTTYTVEDFVVTFQ